MPKVSFILPSARNRFLNRALKSILDQTMQDWELLFFDNYKGNRKFDFNNDKRVRYFKTPGARMAESFNKAKSLVASKYILPMADDDICFPERAQVTYDLMEYNNLDLFYSSYIAINEANVFCMYYHAEEFNPDNHLLGHSVIPSPTFGCKVSTMPDYDEKLLQCPDWDIIWQSHIKGLKFGYTTRPLLLYRIWRGNLTNTTGHENQKRETIYLRKKYNNPAIRKDKRRPYVEDSLL